MVGTSPTEAPSRRQAATMARRPATSRTTTGPATGPLISARRARREGMLRAGEAARPHVRRKGGRRGLDRGADLAVALDEFRGEAAEQPDHVVGHQDLAVAGGR